MRVRTVPCRFLTIVTLLTLLLPLVPAPSLLARQVPLFSTAEGSMHATSDTSSPSTVANLVASTGASPGTVELSWVAPGDDATAGTASAYIVRYNTITITESNWDTSSNVTGEPTPSPAGSLESMTVSGLTPGQRYYFAVKTQDEVPNTSGISNSSAAIAQVGLRAIYLPLVASSASSVPTVIPGTTKVLSETTTRYLSRISGDGAVFTFTQSTSALNALVPGDVMVSDATANAPYGFLRRVTAVSSVGGQVVVMTEAATLEDAIESGEVHISHMLAPDQIQSSTQLKGVTLATASQLQDEFYFEFEDVVLYDDDGDLGTKNDQIRADGTIRLEPGFDLSLVVRHWKLEEPSFTFSVVETAELEIKAEIDLLSVQRKKEIARYYLDPITVMIGPVPVVMVPVLTVNVGVDGSVHVGVQAGVTQEVTLAAGARYVGGEWVRGGHFSNQFYWKPPTLYAGMDLKGYAGAQLTVLLYGVTGPYAEIDAYLKLEADTADDPWWTLYGGLEASVGVKMEVLGHSIADCESSTVIGYRLTLAQATSNTPPNLPFAPYPVDGAIVQNLDADLSWSGGDLDGDAMTYDVYLEANDNTPDVLVSDDQTGLTYAPATLSPNTHYYWRIVAQDEHGATTAGPVWKFSTATGATCPIILILQVPQVSDLTVTVDGSATCTCATITRLNWQWGDGVGNDQWFPASHAYAVSGIYPITVTAYNDLGDARVQTTTADLGVSIATWDVWADTVISATILGEDNQYTDPTQALGPPDYSEQSETGFVSLGGGELVVDMGDGEEIVDAEGNDLRVYNPGGGSGEVYDVYVGNSPREGWVFIGSALGNGQRDFDLNSVGVSQARYVKVVDLSSNLDGAFPGVEIDYIAALHSNHDPYADAVVSSSIVGGNNQATDPTQALGFPDYDGPAQSGYVSLGEGGELIVDMGEQEEIADGPGADLRIFNPGGDPGEIAEVYVSNSPSGPWALVGRAFGDPPDRANDFDIASTGRSQVRYVRIVDVSTGDLTDENPATDIDYIEALNMWARTDVQLSTAMRKCSPLELDFTSLPILSWRPS